MKFLKHFFTLFFIPLVFWSCGSTSFLKKKNTHKEKPIAITNDSTQLKDSIEYEVIIIDSGFEIFLKTEAKPKGFYSLSYLETKNAFYTATWNFRVQNPGQYDPKIYENIIDYDSKTNYGYDLNYNLYNYFKFAEKKYKITLR